MIKAIFVALIVYSALTAPSTEKMTKVPGYPDTFNTSVYSGYLTLSAGLREAHYVFVESVKGANNNDPVTLWLNGGPGCSSLLGFLQEIGPYYLEDGVNYKVGDNLTFNKYSWHNISNLLFLESPAGVGFSYNTDSKFEYNDVQTAYDNFIALTEFYRKFPEYADRGLWIAGESYAGKYIPDLAQLIIENNQQKKTNIKLKGILIGNGIISFQHLEKSEIEFMIARSFVDPQTLQYWKSSCQTDYYSAGCQFFLKRYAEDVRELNPYNVYGYCYYNDSVASNKTKRFESQYSILQKVKEQFAQKAREARSTDAVRDLIYSSKDSDVTQEDLIKINDKLNDDDNDDDGSSSAPCAYFTGISNYFNMHTFEYKAKWTEMKWNGPCASNITYHINPRGSLDAYAFLLSRQTNRSQIVLYSGNWDVVVPYTDTVKNIKESLRLRQSYVYHPWFAGNQHAGFAQLYSGLLFLTVKGASHQVPQAKRQAAFQIFQDTLSGHPEFQHLPQNIKKTFMKDE